MYDTFNNYINNTGLIQKNQKVLLAISGGIDSMVLLHLFEKSGFEYGVVHCNFKLRDKESDGDETFVREKVLQYGVPFYCTSFETAEYAGLKGISIEMAARELRYEYFERIRKQNGFEYIGTAHHQDDVLETFFLNLSRKTGIKGLTGIKNKAGKLIRPLLFANRNEIEQFAVQNYIEYREDSSNNEVVFQRNFIRHKILPLFDELNPAFKKNMLASIDNLKEAENVYTFFLNKEKDMVLSSEKNGLAINIRSLKKSAFPKTLLLEILGEYDFNSSVVTEIYNSLDTESGKQFFSKTHRVIKDRHALFVSPLQDGNDKQYYLEEHDIELFEPLDIAVEKFDISDFSLVKDSNVACIDKDKIEFPLLIRKWKQGDYFQPLGMTGFKKVSDFFIDQKIPVHKKENTWLLCSGQKIVWIMGHRIDNRFKITPDTKKVLKIEISGK
jgi:tRNA(Ile)-lysidine synthase